MTIKERLSTYLKAKRFRQNEFARICGVDPSVLSRIGETTDDTSLRKIDEASDLNIEWLIKGEGEMIKQPTQSAGNVHGHNICGVNINGREIHITCPDEYETLLTIVNENKAATEKYQAIAEKYQAQLDKAQQQIDELISLLKAKL